MNVFEAQSGLLLTVIPVLPLAGAITLWCGDWRGLRTPGRSIALLAAGLSLLAVVAAVVVLGIGEAPRTLTGGRWLVLRDGAGGMIDVSLRWDGLAALWLLVQTAAALPVLYCAPEREQPAGGARSMAAWSLALLGLVDLLALAGNYWLFLVCWELALIAAWRLLASAATDELDARAAYRMLWTGLVGDLPLLVGLLAIWQSFGTFEFVVVLNNAVAEGTSAPESSADVMRGLATFCLVIAALVRCAQFPASNWLPPAAGARATPALWGTLIGVVPTGAFLLLRSAPLLATSPAALTLLVNWGCLSAAVWGCLALTQSDSRRALASFVAGTLGLVCAGIGAAGGSGLESATFLASNLIVMPAALLCLLPHSEHANGRDKSWRRRRAAVCLGMALGSGIWGQEAVLRDLWTAADAAAASQRPPPEMAATDMPPSTASHASSAAAPLAAVLAHLLLSLGLFRTLFRSRPESIPNGTNDPDGFRITIPGVVILSISAVLLVPVLYGLQPRLSGQQANDGFAATDLLMRLCRPGMTGLLMILALLLAWLLVAKSPQSSARLENTFGSLARLSRRGFYIDEACWISCGLPLSICANVLRFLEHHVWERELLSGDDGTLVAPDADSGGEGRSLMPVLALFVAAGAVLVILLLEG
jgi:NADH:ubiquinone oxidoreductase subunit 5 (subunit L)/multisubunit Na+/H+ antiporter MnhA subunit